MVPVHTDLEPAKIWKPSTATARMTVVHCDAVTESIDSIVLRHVENVRLAML
jgi:hypothetical protein